MNPTTPLQIVGFISLNSGFVPVYGSRQNAVHHSVMTRDALPQQDLPQKEHHDNVKCRHCGFSFPLRDERFAVYPMCDRCLHERTECSKCHRKFFMRSKYGGNRPLCFKCQGGQDDQPH